MKLQPPMTKPPLFSYLNFAPGIYWSLGTRDWGSFLLLSDHVGSTLEDHPFPEN